jgi:hypothetical protein
MSHNRPYLAWLLGLAVAAIIAPTVLAAELRPDDRADIRGAGVVIGSHVVRPDDRTGIHGVRTPSFSTPQGLRADGLRWQGLADLYLQRNNRPAASFYTPQGLRADGQRWEAMARAYQRSSATTESRTAGFDWRDAGIGAAGGLGLILAGAAMLVAARRGSRTKAAV